MTDYVCEAEHYVDPDRQRPAADGLRVCLGCRHSLGRNILELSRLHHALCLVLAGGSGRGERVTASTDPNIVLNMTAVFWRENIRSTLAGWCRTVTTERGVHPPHFEVQAMVTFLQGHLDWLSAHRDAGEAVGEFADLAHEKEPRRIAWPSRSERMFIGECPQPSLTEPGRCGARLYADPMEGEILCPGCAHHDTIEGWQRLMFGDNVVTLATGEEIAARLSLTYKRAVDPQTVRQWAHRDKVERHGKDGRGRVLYDWGQVNGYVETIWKKSA